MDWLISNHLWDVIKSASTSFEKSAQALRKLSAMLDINKMRSDKNTEDWYKMMGLVEVPIPTKTFKF